MKPARLAVCQTKSERVTSVLRIARASRVPKCMCGCTSTQRNDGGTGICLTRGLSMPTVSTSPPNRLGAMLSKCAEPLATISPSIANLSNCKRLSGFSSSAFAATTAATAEAAEPPMPDESGIPLSISISNPYDSPSASCIAWSARPAVFFGGSIGKSPATPLISRMRTTGSMMRCRRTRSPTASTVCPRISKPIATLATVAGANAVTSVSTEIPLKAELNVRAEVCRKAQQIREYTAGRDLGTGAGSLHDQRIVAIAARREAHDVIGQRNVTKRVLGVEAREPYGRPARGVDAPDVAQNLLVRPCVGEGRGHRSVEFRQPPHEFLDAAAAQCLRDESLDRDVGHFERQSHFAREDDELARDVQPRQVVARIRFRIALLLRDAHDRGERFASIEDVEDRKSTR